MIAITGAAGFIGSNMVAKLNEEGYINIILVDDFSREDKNRNIQEKRFHQKIHRDEFIEWLHHNHEEVESVYHLGARTDTAEFDRTVFERLNVRYSKDVWNACSTYRIPLVYASSAATYGAGEQGYKDDHKLVPNLQPLNPYGGSKNDFDKWMLQQKIAPPFWAGIKFFNVYGPNEYHKGRMASVVFQAFNQIRRTGKMKLFRSHHPDYAHGQQLRDFIYVKDVVEVLYFLMQQQKNNGIFNLGTGEARTFNDLAKSTFKAMDQEENIEYIDMPEDIRDNYQYFTEADMNKLLSEGYNRPFYRLEDGIRDFVRNYLLPGSYH